MPSLERTFRRQLETTIKQARRVAETGAQQALELLAVHHHESHRSLSAEQRKLRNRLRAHGRQLGDHLDDQKGNQTIDRLASECAYEHWHRLLFARFLAENDLLVEPQSKMPLSLNECREMAREKNVDWLEFASKFAQRMLPQIFRVGDPVLDISLAPEVRQELEKLLVALPREVFISNDSLGWVYQYWQAEKKDQVNESGVKIGADELPSVTQLFTEDYMVECLIHNTIGAWWAGKHGPILANNEEDARKVVSLPVKNGLQGIEWTSLRFIQDEASKTWKPAVGTFDGWPKTVKEISILDPCMGSGHFLVYALPVIARLRMEEEQLTAKESINAVLKDNLNGLEIDPRCTQIGAFNLALAAWRTVGYQQLPELNIACSGLAPRTKITDWLQLAKKDERLRIGLEKLYEMFEMAPILGSLANPRLGGDLFTADYKELVPLLEKALIHEENTDNSYELNVTARGLAKAAQLLAGTFVLIITNVPYLGRAKQVEDLQEYCGRVYPEAKKDLATCMIDRCFDFCVSNGSVALVSPQNWLFQGGAKNLRCRFLRTVNWDLAISLGANGFQTPMWDFSVVLLTMTKSDPVFDHQIFTLNVAAEKLPETKAAKLLNENVVFLKQKVQLNNPDGRIIWIENDDASPLLSNYADSYQGLRTGDIERFVRNIWEVNDFEHVWVPLRSSSALKSQYDGLQSALRWEGGNGELHLNAQFIRSQLHDMHESGNRAWGKSGVALNHINLGSSVYCGEKFDANVCVIIPKRPEDWLAIWTYCSSKEYLRQVKGLDQRLSITNQTLLKVPFDLNYWKKVANEKYPDGISEPFSNDPTQWQFMGHPKDAVYPLQVALARLLGYCWPLQLETTHNGNVTPGSDGLERFKDDDGIVCLPPLNREQPAANRLRALLAAAYGDQWGVLKEKELLSLSGSKAPSLEEWLQDDCFEQHCELFCQRPFMWHIWDGLKNGFSAFVNYHRLVASNGEGRRTLEKLIYTYLGDWIDRQRNELKAGVEGADARVIAAASLKKELENIHHGEPPYDLFVRWKPLSKQPIGWEPDINDGVRINLRPFIKAMMTNSRGKNVSILRIIPRINISKMDRGNEPERPKEQYPWLWSWDGEIVDFNGDKKFDGNRWNNLHYTRKVKMKAREDLKGGKKS